MVNIVVKTELGVNGRCRVIWDMLLFLYHIRLEFKLIFCSSSELSRYLFMCICRAVWFRGAHAYVGLHFY